MSPDPVHGEVLVDTTLCDQACQWLTAGQRFSPGTPASFTNKTDSQEIAEILLKVALNTKTKPYIIYLFSKFTNNVVL